MDLATARELLPELPGVYKFLGARGEVIYVGKARNLRKRVQSYFLRAEEPTCDYKTRLIVRHAAGLEWIVTESEWDALLLENNLIKHYNPRYNVLLKDGKTYPYLSITKEPYPRLVFTRQKVFEGAKYYGPFPGGGMLRSLMELFYHLYKLRDCDLKLTPEGVAAGKFRPCVKYHIGTCAAPCIGKQSYEAYVAAVEEVQELLEGKWEEVLTRIDAERQKAVDALEFERAHELKKRYEQLQAYRQRSVVADAAVGDVEVLSFVEGVKLGVVHHLSLRGGRVVASHTWQFAAREWQENPAEVLDRVIGTLIDHQESVASVVLVDGWSLTYSLPELQETELRLPESPAEQEVAALCRKTAFSLAQQKNAFLEEQRASRYKKELEELMRILHLPRLPRRIECIDNSHIQGAHLVSGVSVFIDGAPRRSEYRRYVQELRKGDDFAAMRWVILRRYEKRARESMPLPDLLLIDGGKGQLSAALEALNAIGLQEIPVFALAKKKEEVFAPGRTEPIYIDTRSPVLRLLQRIRDETHETAIGFHRQRRKAATLRTTLLAVPGIGEKLAARLLEEFGSMEKLKEASLEDLARVVGKRRAALLQKHLSDA
ncbi:MAG: excinuclease ABC subunit UvrC [Bacteroidia bacterium]|nr:excinuclease ABC subunit UvrC [Bacteroidia bacterium]MDW8235958.1 excinuclease ABC subunit UvrC [Bacteroidia bacterium]